MMVIILLYVTGGDLYGRFEKQLEESDTGNDLALELENCLI